MAEYVVPVPTECNPQRFLLHRDMLIHAVMCWNRALDYIYNVPGGIFEYGVRYITFEDFWPGNLSPFYPLSTRDMRINPDQYWRPDARVDRALWQRITDYIRGIVTTDGMFLRDRIGTAGGYVWHRGGPIKTDPDDPETWQYQSGDQDLLRGMQSGRYRPADWIYLSIVGEYHRLVGDPIQPAVAPVDVVREEGDWTRYIFTFTRVDARNVITQQKIVKPDRIIEEHVELLNFAPPQLNTSIESHTDSEDFTTLHSINFSTWDFCRRRTARGQFAVIGQYDWPSYIPWRNEPWIYIDRGVEAELLEYGYNDYVDVPTALRVEMVKRVDDDVNAHLSYALAEGETFSGTQIVVKYGASTQIITPRHLGQGIDFTLTGPRGSHHVISIELSPQVQETYVAWGFYWIDLFTYIYFDRGYERLEDRIGWNDIYKFWTTVSDAPLVKFSLYFAIL